MNKKKRELEQNELADAIDSYYETIKPYMSQVVLITVAVVLGVVAIAFWVSTNRSINEGQWEEFLDSTRFSDVRGMDEVAKIYPETPAGQFALIRAADYDYLRGAGNLVRDRDDYKDKVRKAIERYKKLTGDEFTVDPFLKRRATYALAHSYETLGEFDKAREYYQILVDSAPDASITILARNGLERLADPSLVAIFEQFKTWQPELTGPDSGPLLPDRPNISFPGEADAAPATQPACHRMSPFWMRRPLMSAPCRSTTWTPPKTIPRTNPNPLTMAIRPATRTMATEVNRWPEPFHQPTFPGTIGMSVWSEIRAVTRELLPSRKLGDRGERVAERFLRRRHKMTIITRGYSNHIGEIDLIGIDTQSRPRTVVFVEVKTRTDDRCGMPVEAVDGAKQRQITSTALVYLRQNDLLECRVRFDIVGILWPDESSRPEIRYYPDAFQPADQWQMFS